MNLIPHFIHEQFRQGRHRGSFAAATLFVDIAGFTAITETLMQHEKEGAEALTDALRDLFAPLVQRVYHHGGFIPVFAGDAFTAIFPLEGQGALAALQTAFAIQQFFAPSGRVVHTRYGAFTLSVKIGCAQGSVQWGIPGAAGRYAFYFRGAAIDACAHAEAVAVQGDIITDPELLPLIHPFVATQSLPTTPHHRLLSLSPSLPFSPSPSLAPPLTRADLTPFIPATILDLPVPAEFREVCVVFLTFAEPENEQQVDEFVLASMCTSEAVGGHLAQIDFGDQGNLLVLLFGAPVAYENNGERAAEFVLSLRAQALPLRWRAALTLGTVWAGIRGGVERAEYGAVGDVMNTASRMAMRAPWGEIWLSQRLADQLQSAYQIDALGDMAFKGKQQPQPIYRLIGRVETTQTTLPTTGLVGRQAELRQLQAWVQPIFEGRCAGMMVVRGEAGIGKSRLVSEFHHRLVRNEALLWLHGRADPIGRQSLHLFKRMLRRYFQQSVEQSQQYNQAHFERTLDTLIERLASQGAPGADLQAEVERTSSFLAALVDLHWPGSLYEQLEPQLRFENTLAAFKTLVKAEALLQPVLLELEDLHWLDEDSGRLLQHLTRNIGETPLAILCTTREGDEGEVSTLALHTDVAQAEINLGYLTLDAVKRYAEAVLGAAIHVETARFLRDKTNGNPLFVEQLVADLRDRHLLTPDPTQANALRLKSSASTTAPATLSGLLVARLDRLPAETKRIVQTAAVLGREFETPVLSRMLAEAPDLPTQLRLAEQHQVWTAIQPPRYFFRHALLRDAAYDMQLRARLRTLHRQAGEAIHALYAADLPAHYPDLAYHYDQAAADAEATHWYSLAGEQAAARYANDDALRYFRRALQLAPAHALTTRFQLWLGYESICEVVGDRAGQQASLTALHELANQLNNPQQLVEVALRTANLARLTNEYRAAINAIKQAIPMAAQLAERDLLIKAYHLWGRTLWQQGDYATARIQLAHGLALAQAAGQASEAARCLYDIGITHYYTGDYQTAVAYIRQAQTVYQTINDARGEISATIMFGSIAREQGDYVSAQQDFEKALRLCQTIGWRYGQVFLLGNIGNSHFDLGNYAAAQSYHEQAMAACREVGDREGEALSLATLSLIAHLRHQQTLAVHYAKQALTIQRAIGDKNGEAFSLTYLGYALAAQGELRNALAQHEAAITLRHDLELEGRTLDNLAAIARIALALGDQERALATVEQVIHWLRTQGVDSVELPIQVYLTCYEVLQQTNRAAAGLVLAEGYALLQQRAAAIGAAEQRRIFLKEIPFNCALIAHWEAVTENGIAR